MAKLKNKYYATIRLFWSDEDGEYIADVTDLQNDNYGGKAINGSISVSAGGKSPRLALKELGVALEMALKVHEEDT